MQRERDLNFLTPSFMDLRQLKQIDTVLKIQLLNLTVRWRYFLSLPSKSHDNFIAKIKKKLNLSSFFKGIDV